MAFRYQEFDLRGVHTYPLSSRRSKVNTGDFARPMTPGGSLTSFLDTLPTVLAAADLKAIVAAIVEARRVDGGVVWGLGAHVIKTGLGPVLIDLMRRGFVSAIATNGATVIHDFEIALAGATSEDVEAALGAGQFGMADETGRLLNGAINEGVARGLGLGEAISGFLHDSHPPHGDVSVLTAAAALNIPITVHVALGTDIMHMHADASGAAIGEGSLRDFRRFVWSVSQLERGVYLNCGSAVVLPEVFLKAIALSRNQGVGFSGLTTVNLDFIRGYRPHTNVVVRPTVSSGRGFSLIGHHELLIPLLAAALVEADART